MKDKRALNNIYNAAKAAGKLDEYRRVCQDEDKLHDMLQKHHANMTTVDGKKKKGSPSAKGFFLEYVENFESRDEIIKDDYGEMMHEEEYSEWCGTVKGGKLSAKKAKRQWDELVEKKGSLVTDMKGPEGSELRLRIGVRDAVIFRSAVKSSKQVSMRQKAMKDPTHDALLDKMKGMMTGHDTLRENAGMDMHELARSMASSGSRLNAVEGGGFAGR